jgi:pyridoxal phosphate enzyme (YggS family)
MSSSHLRSSAVALANVLARIDAARATAIASAPSTTLVAVTKGHRADRIRPALQSGHRIFGENRVQEANAKWPGLRDEYPDLELHLIGPLQTNKVREAVELFDVIQTLDRPKLAHALAHEFARSGKALPLFVQVNTGEEPQKAGISPPEAADFIALCRGELKLPVKGLMCVPPIQEPPAPHFALLQKIARVEGLPWLSMGMSADFEIAVKFGATHVRVGTAIFGERQGN